MKIRRIGEKGFSLVELLVVVAIIAMLAAVALPMYNKYKAKAAQSAATAEVKEYIKAWRSAYANGDTSFNIGGFSNTFSAANVAAGACVFPPNANATCFGGNPYKDSEFSTENCQLFVRPTIAVGEVTFTVAMLAALGTDHTTPGNCWNLISADANEFLQLTGGHTYTTANGDI